MKKIFLTLVLMAFGLLLVGCGERTAATKAPTKAPTTAAPTTKAPTTKAPTTKAPTVTTKTPTTVCIGAGCGVASTTTTKAVDSNLPDDFPEDDIQITLYTIFGASKAALLNELIAEFEEMYPNVTITHTSQSDYNTLRETINKAITTGDASVIPTVALGYPDHFAGYIKSNAMVPLDDFINHETWGVDLDAYIDGYVAENNQYVGGYMYSMPFSKSTEVLAYNYTVLDELGIEIPNDRPLTWEEIANFAETIKTKFDFVINYDSPANLFINSVRQWDGDYTNSQGDILVGNSAKTTAMLQYLSSLMVNDTLVLPAEWSESYGSTYFKYGTVAMTVGSSAGTSYNIPKESDTDFAKYKYGAFTVGFAPTPQKKDGSLSAVQQGPNIGIFSSATEEEQLAAWLFVKYITYQNQYDSVTEDFVEGQSNTARWAIDTGYLPVTKTGYASKLYTDFLSIGETYYADGYSDENLSAAQKAKLAYSLSALAAKQQIDYYQYDPAFAASSKGAGSATARVEAETCLVAIFNGTAVNTAISEMVAKLVY